jgi:tetratricopeptide (TPR) repeat protein
MVVAQRGITPLPPMVLLSGDIPPLAFPYIQRPESGLSLQAGLDPGEVVVLTQGEKAVAAPAGQGGTGTTQLAAEFARAVLDGGAVDLLAWVTAASRDAIVSGFAQAAAAVGIDAPDDDARTAAGRFVAWLAHTERPWVLILDNLAAVADLESLWPGGPAGRVVITTRLPGLSLSRTAAGQNHGNLRIVPVGGFSVREALSYLSSQLTADQQFEAIDLIDDLDGLPLGLAQTVPVMSVTGMDCREYRRLLAGRRRQVPVVPRVSAALVATVSLAADCASEQFPVGLAWPMLTLAAILDGDGIPETVFTSPAACAFVAGGPDTDTVVNEATARAAIDGLAEAGLVSIDPQSRVKTVRMRQSVQAAVRAFLAPADLEKAILAAADTLIQAWPEDGARDTPLERALRECGAALAGIADGVLPPPDAVGPGQARPWFVNPLWKTEPHPLLFRYGLSLDASRLTGSAASYWQRLAMTSTRLFGAAHGSTLDARDRLAGAYEAAGRFAEAIALFQEVLADRVRTQGPAAADTIDARRRLAHAHLVAREAAAAVPLYQQVIADSSCLLGSGHPSVSATRLSLADAYQRAGQGREAVAMHVSRVAEAERTHGGDHSTTLSARADLAEAYMVNGKFKDGIEQCRRVLKGQEASRGRDHPDTIAARATLASALRRAGKPKDAIAAYQQVLADWERVVGADHPDTLVALANLAFGYRSAGRLREAVPCYERTLAGRQRVSGIDHADTRIARSNLAGAYLQAGRPSDAIAQYERVLADCERVLGPGDLETLSVRSGLASAQYADGRLVEAIALLKRTLADGERYLGRDHPMTSTVRGNLASISEA